MKNYKKENMKTTLVFIITLAQSSPLSAHIETAECWEKLNKKIYCLADHHNTKLKKNCVSNDQRRSILKGARTFKAHLIVEDKGTLFEKANNTIEPISGSISLIKIYDRLKPDYAVPMALSSLCYRARIPFTNIEFRFLSASDGQLTLNEELTYLNARAKKTLQYDNSDGKELKPFYTSFVQKYKDIIYKDGKIFFEHLTKKKKRLNTNDIYYTPYGKHVDVSLKKILPENYLKNISSYDKKYLLLSLCSSPLIDTEIVHAIAQNKDKDRIIVCAGNVHVEEIASALKAMGYTKTDICSGDCSNCGEPDAIDLDAFFTKHEPTYATAQIKKTFIDYMLDTQCYLDKHPLLAVASGFTILCAFLGIIISPVWCTALAHKLAPKNPKVRSIIQKSLITTVAAATMTGLYKLFTPIKGN